MNREDIEKLLADWDHAHRDRLGGRSLNFFLRQPPDNLPVEDSSDLDTPKAGTALLGGVRVEYQLYWVWEPVVLWGRRVPYLWRKCNYTTRIDCGDKPLTEVYEVLKGQVGPQATP